MNILIGAWKVKEPPKGPGIDSVEGGICGDVAHDLYGDSKLGYWRVGGTDLNIIISNWKIKEPPKDVGIDPNCLTVY